VPGQGVRRERRRRSVYTDPENVTRLVIGMFPEWYAARQADWPPQLRLAGFPLFDGKASAGLPADLVDSAGP
jgi:rhamnosyltransferase subunit B